eukprot:c17489_g1_i1.p1 GENE.c17489_g1_i1~~c17489_g1_i1.p1  ORF type:complete len:185 (+),score=41.59 c17489_g1_i1:306-860(+)
MKEMSSTIQTVERSKVYQIPATEIAQRKKFVAECQAQARNIKQELMNHDLLNDRVTKRPPTNNSNQSQDSKKKSIYSQNNADFIDGEFKQQEQIFKEQEQDLEGLGHTVKRLGSIGVAINQELNHHSKLIDEMDQEVERTQGRLRSTMAKVHKLLEESSDNTKIRIIIFLIIVMVVLLFLVIYT